MLAYCQAGNKYCYRPRNMADRTCPLCKKVFDYPSGLERHKKRRTSCVALIGVADASKPFRCLTCGKEYTHRSSYSRHKAQGCGAFSDAEESIEAKIERMVADKLRLLTTKLVGVSAGALGSAEDSAAPAPKPPVTTVLMNQGTQMVGSNQIQNTDNSVHLHLHQYQPQPPVAINLWGQEDLSWLDQTKVRELFETAIEMFGTDAPEAAVWVYHEAIRQTISNPVRPENLTAYIPNKKDGSPVVHRETGWGVEASSQQLYMPLSLRIFNQLFSNQPFVDCDRYEKIVFHLRDHEKEYHSKHALATVPPLLHNNKTLLPRVFGRLPKPGDPAMHVGGSPPPSALQ